MDCPHCQTENLLGARVCAACGEAMLSAPPRLQARAQSPDGPSARGEDGGRPVSSQPATGGGAAIPSTRPTRAGPQIRRTTDEFTGAGGRPGSVPPSPAPAPRPESRGTSQALCRVCATPFERPAGEQGAALCPSCRDPAARTPGSSPAASSEEPGPPAAGPPQSRAAAAQSIPLRADGRSTRAPSGSFTSPSAGTNGAPRTVVIAERRSRVGPIVAAGALLVCLTGVAVVVLRSGSDRSSELLKDARSTETTIGQAFSRDVPIHLESTLTLHVVREEKGLLPPATKTADVHLTAVQECEAAFVEDSSSGAILTIGTDWEVRQQAGTIGARDASEADLHPWRGHHAAVRVRAPATAPLLRYDGRPVTPGDDVPPIFHLGALGAAASSYRPGDRWRTRLELPLLADGGARLTTAAFPAEISYTGTTVRKGVQCAAFRVQATAPRELPEAMRAAYAGAEGTITGAVWIDVSNGSTFCAELDTSMRLTSAAGRPEETLTVTGRLTIARP